MLFYFTVVFGIQGIHSLCDVQSLELKVPPVALVIIAALLMWMGAVFFPALGFGFPFRSVVAWVIGLCGLVASGLGFFEFRRAKTTLNPMKPGAAGSLVRSGIFRWTRNPMYLGFFLNLVGWAIAMGNVAAFLVLPAFVIYMNRFQIKPEERALASIFGEEYKAYCGEVRRWI